MKFNFESFSFDFFNTVLNFVENSTNSLKISRFPGSGSSFPLNATSNFLRKLIKLINDFNMYLFFLTVIFMFQDSLSIRTQIIT